MKTEIETVKRIYFDENDQQELILKYKELENEVKAYNKKFDLELTVWGFMMIFASRSAYDFLERFSFIPFIGKAWEIAKEEIDEDGEDDEEVRWICEPCNLDCFVQDILKFVQNEYIK